MFFKELYDFGTDLYKELFNFLVGNGFKISKTEGFTTNRKNPITEKDMKVRVKV